MLELVLLLKFSSVPNNLCGKNGEGNMLEASLRKIHRTFGIYLVGFLGLQALTGLLIALGTLSDASRDSLWFSLVAGIHYDWNPVGSVYRVLLAVFTLGQGLGGVAIYFLIRARQGKS